MIEEDKKEDLSIITDEGYRQCYNYETPDWTIEEPINLCYWRERYQNMTHKNKVLSPCGNCNGYNTDCEEYTIK